MRADPIQPSEQRAPVAARRDKGAVSGRSRVVLVRSAFRYAAHPLSFGRAKFYGDRIELVNLGFGGGWRRVIPLETIAHMEFHALDEQGNLSLYLEDEGVVHLRIREAYRWRELFESWLSYSVLASARLMDDPGKASSLSG